MTMRVLAIGYGEMGHAMEALLSGCCELQVWTRHPVPGHEPVELEAAASKADLVLYCIPVTPLEEVARRVSKHIRSDSMSLSVAKGLDEKGRHAAAILQAVYGESAGYGVLYGPMIAEDIIAGRPAYAELATNPRESAEPVIRLFEGSGLVLEPSADMPGISWTSVLKNVYAILFGAADELELGDNVRGALCVACLDEMGSLLRQVGGEPASTLGLAGLGDLVATATSESSNHHEIGRRLARGETENISGEGIHTLEMLARFSLLDETGSPLLRYVREITVSPGDIRTRLPALLESTTKSKLVQ